MKIVKYREEYKMEWDSFVSNSKNGHFFFQRNYMEYHADRFCDFSLLFFNDKENLIAILPANMEENIVYSHQGLTFGGFLVNEKMKAETMLEIFETLKDYLRNEGIHKLVYKCIPYIYHRLPSEEDLYALFYNKARLVRRDVSSTILLEGKVKYQLQRQRAIKKAIKNGLEFGRSDDFESYWAILEEILHTQHDTMPVHSLDEIKRLSSLFPDNIKLFVAKKNGKVLGGTLIFENEDIVHTQYLANSSEGKKTGALDFVIDSLISKVYKDKKYLDFGMSNENKGKYLNLGLIAQKEGFGAGSVVYDFYELDIP